MSITPEGSTCRKLWLTQELYDQLAHVAWSQHTNVSAIVRPVIEDISTGKLKDKDYAKEDVTGLIQRSISVVVDDDLWMAARDIAYPSRKSLAKLVRLRLIKLFENQPVSQLTNA